MKQGAAAKLPSHGGMALRGPLALAWLALLSACSYHPPAPIEEHSSAIVKRQLTPDGKYYVRKGDTLYAIAFGYGLDFRDVADWNGIARPYTIFPGQELQLAPPRGKDTVTPKSGAQTRAVTTPGSATTRDISKSSPTAANSVPAKTTAAKPAAGSTGGKMTGGASVPVRMTTSAEPASWQWPTNGRVMRGYVAGNPARNGLDIAGKEGQAVWATAAGQVVYSGNGLIGYGELIIIKHSDKLLSAYGHNKVRLVNEGDQVAAGQRIAQMGRNPGNEQILHFEIRVQGKPVNPLTYLPKK